MSKNYSQLFCSKLPRLTLNSTTKSIWHHWRFLNIFSYWNKILSNSFLSFSVNRGLHWCAVSDPQQPCAWVMDNLGRWNRKGDVDKSHTCEVHTPWCKHTFAPNIEGTAQRSKGSSPHSILILSAEIMESLNGALVFSRWYNQTPPLNAGGICFVHNKCVSISKAHLHPKNFCTIAYSYACTEGHMHT